jgi:UPF0716 protein FxsA
MGWIVILGVVALPVIEIMLWVKSAALIGAGATILLSVGAVVAGLMLLQRQGLSTLLEARARLDQGEMPVEEAFDGLCLSLAGLLLVLPGFLTDALALILLIPAVRVVLWSWVQQHGTALRPVAPGGQAGGGGGRPVIIETEYEVVEAERPPAPRHDP